MKQLKLNDLPQTEFPGKRVTIPFMMSANSLPSLNLDSHTAALFPDEAKHGQAQARITYRPGYDEDPISLLCRFVPFQPWNTNYGIRGEQDFAVILRPEQAKDDSTFWCGSWMNDNAAEEFDWREFEKVFNNPDRVGMVRRIWTLGFGGKTWILLLDADGGAYIERVINEDGYSFNTQIPFYWRAWKGGTRHQFEAHLLNTSKAELEFIFGEALADDGSEFRGALKWALLSPDERDAIAFACQNGTWEELRMVARHALAVRLSRVQGLPTAIYGWEFCSFNHTFVEPIERIENPEDFTGPPVLWDDAFLRHWRAALIEHFQPPSIRDELAPYSTPIYILSHFTRRELNHVIINSSGLLNIEQSEIFLLDWVEKNCSPERAKELKALISFPAPEAPPTGTIPFEPPTTFPPDMAEFWELWRQERFWGCHEALEEVWRAEEDPARRVFLQGLIHCAVAVFQHRRGNAVGAARQWVRAKVRLGPFLPVHEDLLVTRMLVGVNREIDSSLQQPHQGLEELEARLRVEVKSKM